ncbi:protein MALE DISCOVERER 2-like isoform X2 [Musa acuminata AAA Group]|uniref:protein MALE DISCOVERER 2-like isoform X2 n=1 Tax=Musa acuminata AAA Group TaxID=214697 RepID=UPI0008A0DB42|nr:PREDICTED: protein MALE DISCOVERER 2-like isoform X2 [Musa acuminata subsp. malaccensis]
MGGRWKLAGFHLRKVLCVVLIIHLFTDECLSINLEGLALLQFRSRVESDPYGALANWNPGDNNPCNWTGVHCLDGKVVTLNLKEFSLRGILAPEIGKLSHLRTVVLYKNKFSGVIPKEIAGLTMLELLDLRNNMLNGIIPKEIGEMLSLKHLLLCHNKFQGNTHWIENPDLHFDLMHDQNLSCNKANDLGHVNRKVGNCFGETGWQKLKKINSFLVLLNGKIIQIFDTPNIRLLPSSIRSKGLSDGNEKRNNNLATGFGGPYVLSNVHEHTVRRRLAEETRNLHAAPGSDGPLNQVVSVPPTASGSFPAIRDKSKLKPSLSPISPSLPPVSPSIAHPESTPTSVVNDLTSSRRSAMWKYILVLLVAALFLALATCIFLVCHSKGVATIGPWKTGLSGQLQKAFVTGVPKLKCSELEAACEDFSNIICSHPNFIVYKGTLSSGVEVAVVSTSITSVHDWSKHSEMLFRKKVDTLSRINHKNFVNLLGYCEEDVPFMRMMVLEYPPNGTVYEHLHEEFENLEWSARMRIIMGTAYCLQHIHELTPPISHPNLLSSTILISEDFAAKVADFNVWKEIIAKGKTHGAEDLDDSETVSADPASNVYSFGILLLEIVSGKVPHTGEQDSLFNLLKQQAAEYANGDGGIDSLLDPALKSHKDEELRIICEVIQECVNPDPCKRPTMKEVASKLSEVISITPEAATPRLCPLWWAELEILSVEAT